MIASLEMKLSIRVNDNYPFPCDLREEDKGKFLVQDIKLSQNYEPRFGCALYVGIKEYPYPAFLYMNEIDFLYPAEEAIIKNKIKENLIKSVIE